MPGSSKTSLIVGEDAAQRAEEDRLDHVRGGRGGLRQLRGEDQDAAVGVGQEVEDVASSPARRSSTTYSAGRALISAAIRRRSGGPLRRSLR